MSARPGCVLEDARVGDRIPVAVFGQVAAAELASKRRAVSPTGGRKGDPSRVALKAAGGGSNADSINSWIAGPTLSVPAGPGIGPAGCAERQDIWRQMEGEST